MLKIEDVIKMYSDLIQNCQESSECIKSIVPTKEYSCNILEFKTFVDKILKNGLIMDENNHDYGDKFEERNARYRYGKRVIFKVLDFIEGDSTYLNYSSTGEERLQKYEGVAKFDLSIIQTQKKDDMIISQELITFACKLNFDKDKKLSSIAHRPVYFNANINHIILKDKRGFILPYENLIQIGNIYVKEKECLNKIYDASIITEIIEQYNKEIDEK